LRKTSQNVLRIPAAKVSSIITFLLIVRVSYNKVDLVEAAKVEKKEEIEKQVLLVLMVEMLEKGSKKQNGNLKGICLIGIGPLNGTNF